MICNRQTITTDKMKIILGNDPFWNTEIMFKTNEESYVTLIDEVLQNLQKDGLQYQVIDEESRMGELQELHLICNENSGKMFTLEEHSCLIIRKSFFSQ